jgi:murein DD-endopeptidase MepM/ murein hydrolase activator NlpD
VVAGETAYSISRRYGVDVASLARVNDLDSANRIRAGQALKLPEAKSRKATVARREAGPVPRSEQSARTAPAKSGLPPRAGSFRWPVRGEILASYGPQAGGQHNDGINIGAPAGTPIVASEAGIVAYVGDDLETLGNLILIRHSDGWVTAYAHNETVAVERGVQVARGDVIGRTGESGNVDRPQLHFEIRKETEAVDPLRYLGERTAARR